MRLLFSAAIFNNGGHAAMFKAELEVFESEQSSTSESVHIRAISQLLYPNLVEFGKQVRTACRSRWGSSGCRENSLRREFNREKIPGRKNFCR